MRKMESSGPGRDGDGGAAFEEGLYDFAAGAANHGYVEVDLRAGEGLSGLVWEGACGAHAVQLVQFAAPAGNDLVHLRGPPLVIERQVPFDRGEQSEHLLLAHLHGPADAVIGRPVAGRRRRSAIACPAPARRTGGRAGPCRR